MINKLHRSLLFLSEGMLRPHTVLTPVKYFNSDIMEN